MAANFEIGQRVNDPDMVDRALKFPRLDAVVEIGLAVCQCRREPANQRRVPLPSAAGQYEIRGSPSPELPASRWSQRAWRTGRPARVTATSSLSPS